MKISYIKQLNKIDRILRKNFKELSKEEKEIFSLIEKNKFLRQYFFNNTEEIEWFAPLKKLGYFDASKNPKPRRVKNGYQIREWEVLPYLEKVSLKTRNLDNELIKIIIDISLYRDGKNEHVDNYRTWWFFVKILENIPLSKVPLKIFRNSLPIWLTSKFDLTLPGSDLVRHLLPKYLNQIETRSEREKVENLINAVLSIEKVRRKKTILGTSLEVKTKISSHWLEESFLKKDLSILIAKKCSNAPIFGLANTIRDVFNKKHKKQDYSHVWMKDLTKEEKRSLHKGEYFLAMVLRKLILEKSKYNFQLGREIVDKFLSDDYPHFLFKRLAILLIAESWNNYYMHFENILTNNKENFFDQEAYFIELSYLLTANAKEFTNKQKSKLIKIFEKGPTQYLPDKKQEEYRNYWRKRWYKTLIKLPEFENLYKEIKKIAKKEIVDRRGDDQIDFDKSPLSTDQLLKKDNKEIVKYINNYKPIGDFPTSSPEGVQSVFQSAVKLDPNKFVQDLDPFKKVDYHTISSLVSGLKEAWVEKKKFQWRKVIEYLTYLVNNKQFWKSGKKNNTSPYNYFDWALSSIGYLLQEGCKSDSWSFNENLHGQIESIITTIIKKLPYDESSHQGDSVTHALNSTWGRILTALIYLSLREARLSDKRKEQKTSKWNESLKKDLEASLARNIDEAYALLGQYLPNLHYIDKEWVESKTEEIHLLENDQLFEAFMDGYLFSGKVSDVLYKTLIQSYERALKINFKESRIKERLIQHIAVSYLRGNEKIGESSLIDKIIKKNNSGQIREIIEFLWHQREYVLDKSSKTDKKMLKEKEDFRKRIMFFWDFVILFYKKKKSLNESDKKAISELSKLAVYLPMINKKSFERLLFSAPFVTIDFDSPFFIEYLNSLKGKKKQNPKYVAVLFLAMVRGAKDIIPGYDWQHIEEIIRHLYQTKDKEVQDIANQVCNIYAEHGNYNLRKIYEENNP